MAALFLSQPRYLGSPLCLENICRINLLFRLEEYPIQQLLLLPPPVRRDLSLGLSLVDVLHYEAAGLFHDVDIAGVVESARQKLLNVALGTRCNLTDLGFIPSILPALVPEKHLEEPNSILEHISESFSSLPFTVKHLWPTMIFPNRFISIISPMDSGVDHYKKSFEMLLQYCHFLTAPKEVRLDVYYFTGSPLWVKFDKKMVIRDPVIPFLQSFLSLVETIELESIALTNKYDKNFVTKECSTMQATSYVILYNILTSQQPCLKHIKIYEVHRVIEMILNTVEKFFSDCHNYFPTSQEFPLHLATPPPAPYPLKCLSITHEPVAECDEPVGEYFRLDREYAANISFSTRAIVLYQLHSLEHLSINCGTDFCYGSRLDCEGVSSEKFAERSYSIPEHRALLSTLTDLLKQPQLQSLSVGRAPLTEAYQLVEVFLCTETTHSLSLTIEGIEEEHTWTTIGYDDYSDVDWIWREDDKRELSDDSHAASATTSPVRPPPAQPLPDSNGALKSLNIGCSCDSLHTWLFSIPNLQLKELSTSRPDLVPSGVTLTVEAR